VPGLDVRRTKLLENFAMYHDPEAQFHEDLVASYRHLTKMINSGPIGMSKGLKAAVQASSALFHFREHLPSSMQLTKAQAKTLYPDYGLLEDITNVSKHRTLTMGTPKIANVSAFSDYVYIIQFEDDQGLYTHVIKQVRVSFPTGGHVDAMVCITRVLNFWGKYLLDNGVLASFTPYPEPSPVEFVNVSRHEAMTLDMESIEGVRFKGLGIQFLVHDPIEGGNFPPAVPLMSVQMNLCKRPPVVLSLTYKSAEKGEEVTRSYEITEDEEIEFKSLIAPDTQSAFINRIVSSRVPVPPEEVSNKEVL